MNSRKAFECIGLQCLHVRHCTTILHGKWNALPFTLIYPVCPCLSSLWLEVWILGFWLFGPGPVSPGLWQFPKSDELDISGQMDYKHHPATRNMSAVSGVCLNFSFIMFRKMFRKSLPNWVNRVNVLFWCWAFQKKGRSVFFFAPCDRPGEAGAAGTPDLQADSSDNNWLVVTGTMEFWMTFHINWESYRPNWRTPLFFRGVETRNHQPDVYLSLMSWCQGQPPQAEIAQTIETQVNPTWCMFWTLESARWPPFAVCLPRMTWYWYDK